MALDPKERARFVPFPKKRPPESLVIRLRASYGRVVWGNISQRVGFHSVRKRELQLTQCRMLVRERCRGPCDDGRRISHEILLRGLVFSNGFKNGFHR
jgi:hypothetical protein